MANLWPSWNIWLALEQCKVKIDVHAQQKDEFLKNPLKIISANYWIKFNLFSELISYDMHTFPATVYHSHKYEPVDFNLWRIILTYLICT